MLLTVVIVTLAVLAGGCRSLDNWDQYNLIWQDEFDYLDIWNKWQHEVTCSGGGSPFQLKVFRNIIIEHQCNIHGILFCFERNNEFQLYSQDSANSFVKDGKLFIKPTLLADSKNPKTNQPYGHDFMKWGTLNVWDLYGTCTNQDNGGCYRTGAAGNIPPVMSARLRTFQKFSFTYGRVVISAKMPVGDWLWPAIWMLPEGWSYGGWPRSGEIDIVESIGNRDLVQNGEAIGIQKMGSTLHWGPSPGKNRWWKSHLPKREPGWNYGDNFHKYILDWSPNGLRFFIDDENQALLDVPYPLVNVNPWWRGFWEWGKPWGDPNNPWAGGSNMAPFDKSFHFILNVAVGGTGGFIPDGASNRQGVWYFQKPWSNGDSYVTAMKKFYDSYKLWQWTWDQEGDNNAMQIDYIRVYQRK